MGILELTIPMATGNGTIPIHPVLLWDDQDIILVDCGGIDAYDAVEQELLSLDLSISALTGLVLTHHDHDHMGSAFAIKRVNPAIKIYASKLEAPYITQEVKPLRLEQAEAMQATLPEQQQAFGKAFVAMLRKVQPVGIDEFLSDGQLLPWCGGCEVMVTSGHTPGHISLYLEHAAIVIAGDAMALEDGLPSIANPQFTLDLQQAEQSLEKLLELKASAYYCYHGGIYIPKDIHTKSGNN